MNWKISLARTLPLPTSSIASNECSLRRADIHLNISFYRAVMPSLVRRLLVPKSQKIAAGDQKVYLSPLINAFSIVT